MKALEILKNAKSFGSTGREIIINKYKLDEAIKELEDLQNISCATCKYGHTYHFDEDIECMKLGADTQGLYFEKDFYCKNWESRWQ